VKGPVEVIAPLNVRIDDGWTGLPSQRACLDMVGVSHDSELACVLVSMCLAWELSFYGAMAAGESDQVH
jgi:hydroxymethylglutaryl-CoA reductase